MKRCFFVFLSVIALCSFQIVAMAEEFAVYDSDPILDDRELIFEDGFVVEAGEDFYVGVADPADGAIQSVSVMSLNPISPSDTSGLKAVLLELIGDYDAVVVEYQYQNNNMTGYNYLREVQPDYVWLVSAGLLTVVVYCVFRLGGVLLRE